MSAHIHAIGTAVPPHAYHQDYALERMQKWIRDPALRRMARRIYRHSGIERRHSVLPDFMPGGEAQLFSDDETGRLSEPPTGTRNKIYAHAYPPLARDAVTQAFARAPHLRRADVTHVVTASCTGFVNPGPDLYLVDAFGLAPSVERYHLGFMGCYAAFPALRMAEQFCRLDPDAVVLVLCVELCSLHLQVNDSHDMLLANALFADGAGAALVSAHTPRPGQNAMALDGFATRLAPEGLDAMAWTIGNHGFDMKLSGYVPKILGDQAMDLAASAFRQCEVDPTDITAWAVHPGGKAILDHIERSLSLPHDALAISRSVLRDFGNMSSATILFVLERMLAQGKGTGTVAAMAFGPGLTVEFGLLRHAGHPGTPCCAPAATQVALDA